MTTLVAMRRRAIPGRPVLMLALAYGAAALVSLLISRQQGSIATIWYANAVAVACLVFRPRREWPWMALALAATLLGVNVLSGTSLEVSMLFVPPNLVEIFVGAWLLHRRGMAQSDLRTPAALLTLLLHGALLPQLLAASAAALLFGSLVLADPAAIWLSWIEGSVIGAMSMLPLTFLLLRARQTRAAPALSVARSWRVAALAAIVVATALLALLHLRFPFVYVVLPMLFAAMVVNYLAVALLTALLSLTMAGALAFGLFVPPPAAAPWMQVFVYLAFAAALMPAQLLSAAVAHLRDSHDRLAERSQELDRAHAGLQQFVRIASHDLREPLNTITQFAGLIEQDHGEQLPPEGRQYLSIVNKGALRMRAVLDAVLEYARVQQMAPGTPTPVDLATVMQAVREALGGRLRLSNGTLVVGPMPVVPGHEVMLTLMFQNLVANGLKFVAAERAPRVSVQAAVADGWVHVDVADNGIGIAAADQSRLFQPFQRLHLRREFEGTGLGLTLCRQIAEAHGGRIEIAPAPGEGSCFRVCLPLGDAPAPGSMA